jgi:uncharacterized protein YbjT (DUF2867 family)
MNFYAEAFVQQAQAALNQGVLTGLAENRAAFVAGDDVAAAAAGILIGNGHAGAIYNATGPERLSGAERAGLIAETTGRPLAFRVITEEQLRAGLTPSLRFLWRRYIGMADGYHRNKSTVAMVVGGLASPHFQPHTQRRPT